MFLCYPRWFFSIYAGVGLIALPLDLILEYIRRPIRMKESEFTAERQKLANELAELKREGDQIKVEEAQVGNTEGWWARRSKKSSVNSKVRKLEIQISQANKKFEKLKIQADYNKLAHPICYALKLVLGIICVIISLFWLLHM
jgi:LMBR1 domain-containing protein 1